MNTSKKTGIIEQIYALVIVGIVIMGIITYYSQHRVADRTIRTQAESYAMETATGAAEAIKEYPAHEWLIRYWHDHCDELDIEYDVDYHTGVKTEAKCDRLMAGNPGFQIKYATTEMVESLSPADQKLYAEITYSWLITEINGIKRVHDIDFLYCVMFDRNDGEDMFKKQFFLFSGAAEGQQRGEQKNEVYTLGKINDVSDNNELQKTLKELAESPESNAGTFENSGHYADYFAVLGRIDPYVVMVGVSESNSDIKEAINAQARVNTGYSLVYELILIQILMTHLYLYGIRPLKFVLKNIRSYTESKDSATINARLQKNMEGMRGIAIRNNEIGQLSEDFVNLTQEIDHYVDEIEQITITTQRIMTELELASSIQQSMLPGVFPPFPNRKEFDIFASMNPAREVGGDFYDFFLIDDDHLCLVVADVSGKGIPAALFMILSKYILQSYAQMIDSPSQILYRMNETICANNEQGMFITVWIGILEISTGRMVCSNAGHEHPLLMDPDSYFEEVIKKSSFVIGGLPDIHYEDYELHLKPGSKLFLYSDGAPEAMDGDKNMFGMEGLLKAVNHARHKKPEEVVQSVTAAIDQFVGEEEQFDDTTMVCLGYYGRQEDNA